MEEKLIYKHRVISHPLDVEYFKEFPAPLMELIHSGHFTNINSTIAFYAPLFYFFARAIEAHTICEIGHAECYSAWYWCNAIKDNGIRYDVKTGMYYGIDIVQSELAKERLKGLPNTIINMDSILLTLETFKGITFDIIFQDGNHDASHIVHEFETMWPQLRGDGKGYFLQHDVYGPGEEGCTIIRDRIAKGEFKAEYVRLDCAYGLAIIRKMENYEYDKKHWVD